MAHWHKVGCSNPTIIITGDTPRCAACDSTPDIQSYVDQQKASTPFTLPPPDQPLGKLNLHWPSSVKYTRQTAEVRPLEAVPMSKKQKLDVADKVDETKVFQSSIYTPRLREDEFRLLYLNPSTDNSSPIHTELAVHQDGRSPQYEATSYTWAGEDGDNSQCRPVYIGRYWDVVLQTQNCWSMLQSLRLPIGTRAVWVDALCINQNDIKERDSQVTKMSQMYINCSRVVVYLGPDLATLTQTRYPAQQELRLRNSEESMGIEPDHLRALLQRRYFSRIWVIQELVLARRVAFQIGDLEYWMDSDTMKFLEAQGGWDWNSTTAPWIRNLGQRKFEETDILRVLRATHRCQCADPRDRVFGILSLLSNESLDSVLRADYTLSFQDMVIGVFSHALLNLKNLDVLFFAAGRDSLPGRPSWMPDLEVSNHTSSSLNFLVYFPDDIGAIFHLQNGSVGGETRLGECYDIVGDYESKHPWKPWHLGATVDGSTGTLSIDLIHLFEFKHPPQKRQYVESVGGEHLFTLSGRHSELLLSSTLPLDELIVPARDHIFCLDTGNGPCLFLVLSLDNDQQAYKVMGTCSHIAFQIPKLRIGNDIHRWNAYEGLHLGGLHMRSLHYNLHDEIQVIDRIDPKSTMWTNNSCGTRSLRTCLNIDPGSDLTFRPLFMSLLNENIEPGFMATLGDCIPESFTPQVKDNEFIQITITKAHATDNMLDWLTSWDLYSKWRPVGEDCVGPELFNTCSCPIAFGDTFKQDAIQLLMQKASLRQADVPDQNMPDHPLAKQIYKYASTNQVENVTDHCATWERGHFYIKEIGMAWPEGLAIQMQLPRHFIESNMERTMAWKTLRRLNSITPITSEDDLDAVLRNPSPEFRSISVPGWPAELVEDFNIDALHRIETVECGLAKMRNAGMAPDEPLCELCQGIDWRNLKDLIHYPTTVLLAFSATRTELLASKCRICRLVGYVSNPGSCFKKCKLEIGRSNWREKDAGVVRLAVRSMHTQSPLLTGYDKDNDVVGYLVAHSRTKAWPGGARDIEPLSVDFESFKRCIRDCSNDHRKCRSTGDWVSRLCLIDVDTGNIEQARTVCRYVALSYVWGKDQSTKKDVNEFPAAVKDTMSVTRSLGCQYLWVDRYCIDQESEHKMEMINQMDRVYANAFVTIVAAAGDGASYGLPGISRPREVRGRVTIGETHLMEEWGDALHIIKNNTWTTRGWTYQEGYLSTRCLIFTDKEVVYLCNENHLAEEHPSDVDYNATRLTLERFSWMIPAETTMGVWTINNNLGPQIEEYTSRNLTNDNDSLNALIGILKHYESLGCSEHEHISHIWGIPIQRLNGKEDVVLFELSWKHKEVASKRRAGFPSWSWAGWTGAIEMRPGSGIFSMAIPAQSIKEGSVGAAVGKKGNLEDTTWSIEAFIDGTVRSLSNFFSGGNQRFSIPKELWITGLVLNMRFREVDSKICATILLCKDTFVALPEFFDRPFDAKNHKQGILIPHAGNLTYADCFAYSLIILHQVGEDRFERAGIVSLQCHRGDPSTYEKAVLNAEGDVVLEGIEPVNYLFLQDAEKRSFWLI
ncbi:HET-domain-containing protein [Fusarium austroafricanum]|uniref:HET-domain-containing protein n=1 Tax=Fusarium austroafricanum TaxID=2364996 RepID=A0A8H4KDZ3_9HYPO|nr:HET-domain-containing protein [Fusarium austroafricanum]